MTRPAAASRTEAGFTLVEALIAIVILVFGLMAITNLLVVSAASNQIGNHSNATATHATEIMERLKSRRFDLLTPGGNVDSMTPGSISNCDDQAQDCVIPGNFNARRNVPGIGNVQSFWAITSIDGQTIHIRVRSQSTGSLVAGRRSRAEFTSMRSCTSLEIGCPSP